VVVSELGLSQFLKDSKIVEKSHVTPISAEGNYSNFTVAKFCDS